MFGNVIYYDEKKLNEYKSVASGKQNVKILNLEIENDKNASINFPLGGIGAKSNKSYSATIEESLLYNCNEFEKYLEDRDDYFDFTISGEYDISTLQRGYIIKIDGFICIPNEFDMAQALHQYRELFLKESPEMKDFINDSNTKVPLIIQHDEISLCGKIESDFLKIKYVDLEEYENIEVTILARVMSSRLISKTKPIYDPLKDFITFNREIRRKFINDRPDELNEIYIDEDYVSIEIIAIYQ
jgi:hypothetical protein